MTSGAIPARYRSLQERLASLDADVRTGERARLAGWRARLDGSPFAGSAANLAAYLAFRENDIRDLQDELATLGLSSLGRAEASVRATIAAVRAALDAILGDASSPARIAGSSLVGRCGQPSGQPARVCLDGHLEREHPLLQLRETGERLHQVLLDAAVGIPSQTTVDRDVEDAERIGRLVRAEMAAPGIPSVSPPAFPRTVGGPRFARDDPP